MHPLLPERDGVVRGAVPRCMEMGGAPFVTVDARLGAVDTEAGRLKGAALADDWWVRAASA
jgi:hypothetical protein